MGQIRNKFNSIFKLMGMIENCMCNWDKDMMGFFAYILKHYDEKNYKKYKDIVHVEKVSYYSYDNGYPQIEIYYKLCSYADTESIYVTFGNFLKYLKEFNEPTYLKIKELIVEVLDNDEYVEE